MTPEEFLPLLSRFAEQPVPATIGRHVYLWHGKPDRLAAALPASAYCTLDLHQLASTLTEAPRSVDAARRLLLKLVRERLATAWLPDRQQVLVVTGCDLLSRYQVPITPFFEVASERTAVVFVVSPDETHFPRPAELPDYVTLLPQASFDYLRGMSGGPIVVNADGGVR